MQKYTKKYIEDKYNVALPAGLQNLSRCSVIAIKADQERMIERVRKILQAGGEPTEQDLSRERF